MKRVADSFAFFIPIINDPRVFPPMHYIQVTKKWTGAYLSFMNVMAHPSLSWLDGGPASIGRNNRAVDMARLIRGEKERE